MPRSTSIEWMRTPAAGATGDVTAGVAAICPRTVVDCTRVLCAREPATLFFAGPGLILMAYSL